MLSILKKKSHITVKPIAIMTIIRAHNKNILFEISGWNYLNEAYNGLHKNIMLRHSYMIILSI